MKFVNKHYFLSNTEYGMANVSDALSGAMLRQPVAPPPNPPDKHGAIPSQKLSFRDKLMGCDDPLPKKDRVDLIGKTCSTLYMLGGWPET